ncbi:exodeoxyribonuclease V subunit alpha, partial [Francisella tularensis subsp. holarctica]|nr:exodeoxyribonuclease V subunit alpha [Francisella tularensis subsp. holarctica]
KPIDSNYKGNPIMITQNSYSLGLCNGDVGIMWPDDTGKLRAYFDGNDAKAFSLNMLPKYESVYAMTIHKTHGSEFVEIVIILPAEDNE